MCDDFPQSRWSGVTHETYDRRVVGNITKKTTLFPVRPDISSVRYSCQHCGSKSFPFSQLPMHISKNCLSSKPECIDSNFKTPERLKQITCDQTTDTTFDPLRNPLLEEDCEEILDLNMCSRSGMPVIEVHRAREPCNNLPALPVSLPETSPGLFDSPLSSSCEDLNALCDSPLVSSSEDLAESCASSVDLDSDNTDLSLDPIVRESQNVLRGEIPQGLIGNDNTSFELHSNQKECNETNTQNQEVPCKQSFKNPTNCIFCSKPFFSDSLLARHEQQHRVNQCKLCEKNFFKSRDLEAHIKRFHTVKKSRKKSMTSRLCSKCGKIFATSQQLMMHWNSHKAKNLSCDVCDYKCSVKYELKIHMLKHTGEKPHLCETCGAGYRTPTLLRYHHKSKHTNERRHACPTCGESFRSIVTLSNHEFVMHGKEDVRESLYACPVCGVRCRPALLPDHMNSHTGDLPYPCDLCDKSCPSKHALSQHKNVHKKKSLAKQTFECPVCNEEFKSYKLRNEHQIEAHKSDKTFVCNICNRRFVRRVGLMVHIRRCHKDKVLYIDDNDVPPAFFKCDHCGKLTKTKTLLLKHIKVIHGCDDYPVGPASRFGSFSVPCTVCNRMYSTTDTLWAHQVVDHRVYSGIVDESLSCPLCKKSYPKYGSLVQHVRLSHREKVTKLPDHPCPICGKLFVNSTRVATHMMMHNDVRNFSCTECPQKCRNQWALNTHMRTHTGERPYPCDLCDQAFAQTSTRNQHMQNIHHVLPGSSK